MRWRARARNLCSWVISAPARHDKFLHFSLTLSCPRLLCIIPHQTDEEQQWLEQMMSQQAAAKQNTTAPPDFDEPEPEVSAAPERSAEELAAEKAADDKGPGDYDDVMKLIEENRKKNEAKRAAQSARNAEIVAAFEQRGS